MAISKRVKNITALVDRSKAYAIAEARAQAPQLAFQGNLDPTILFAPLPELKLHVQDLDRKSTRLNSSHT